MRVAYTAVGTAFAAMLLFSASGVATAAPSSSSEPNKQACVDAATRGQIQRDDGKLHAAAEAFAVCASSTCPVAVRKSCTEWLSDAEAKMPHLTVRTEDTGATALTIDGATAPFDKPQTLDPGRHNVKVDFDKGRRSFVSDFTLAASESKTIAARAPIDPPPPPPKVSRPIPVPVFVLGGVFVLGMASWATFGLMAKSDTDQLQADCAPACRAEDKDSAFTKALVADISLGVGIIAAAGAAYFFFTRPTKVTPAAASQGGLQIGPGSIHGVF